MDAAQYPLGDGRIDGVLRVQPPRSAPISFVVEAKLSTDRLGIRALVERLLAVADGRPALIITDYANPALRQTCEAAGVSYLDLTGWAYLRDDTVDLFVRNQGSVRPPAPPVKRGTAMVRLDGPGASQVVRTLWGVPLPVGVRDLATKAGVSPGTAAKVLSTLTSYGAVGRGPDGAVVTVDHRLLIERWTQDYGVYTTNPEVHWLLAPRGPDHAYADLINLRIPSGVTDGIALTGYMGGLLNLPEETYSVIPHTLLSIYSENPSHLIDALQLRKATPTTANVVIIRPKDSGLLRTYPFPVPIPQVLADLLTMGGRFRELTEQWFETTVTAVIDRSFAGLTHPPGPAPTSHPGVTHRSDHRATGNGSLHSLEGLYRGPLVLEIDMSAGGFSAVREPS